MADKTISQLTEATTINGEDLFVINQSGAAKKISWNTFKNKYPFIQKSSSSTVTFTVGVDTDGIFLEY